MKKILIILVVLIIIMTIIELQSKNFPFIFNDNSNNTTITSLQLLKEESAVISAVENAGPSVVTIGVKNDPPEELKNAFDLFFPEEQIESDQPKEEYIGSGFIVNKNGLVVTNKHVVSERDRKYLVIDDNGNVYNVESIYRDPANDIAILQTESTPNNGFKQIEIGDSSELKVGQFVIAIGTALGKFPSTVTTGVVSGLGRGITAGSAFQGFVEELDNVIQTDAAINPGNSGGPLLNSSGQVIAINTAVSKQGENIGFAIPINIVKDSIDNFNRTGRFSRPYLGVSYTIISQRVALLNDVPQGVFVQATVPDSAADDAGIRTGDIITEIDGKKIMDKQESFAILISRKSIGDKIELKVFRDEQILILNATLKKTND